MKRIAIFFLIAGLLPAVLSAEFGLGLPGVIKKRVERLDQKILERKPALSQPQPLKAWGSATLIETDTGNAEEPQVALDSAGNGLAVWQQHDGALYNIWANRYVQGAGWGSATLIETDTGNAYEPQVALDTAGNGLAVWQQYANGTSSIWANRYVSGAWGSATIIETDNTGNADYPQVALDTAGNGLAVWYQHDGTRYNIWANRFSQTTGTWSSATLIETNDAYGPQVALDTAGNGLAVWYQHDGTRYNIWANRFSQTTGTWSTATLIETDNAGHAYYPQVALDTAGNAIAIWQQYDGTRYNIWANRYLGTGWGLATLIETDNTGDAYIPQVALDTAGNGLAVWRQWDGTRYNIWANRFTQSTGLWSTATLIETDTGHAYGPQVALDAAGNGIAVWKQHDGTWYSIWANRYTPSTGWGQAELIETDNIGNALYPQVALDTDGNGLAVWEQSDGTRQNIWANRYRYR
ncbi:hypothetical protein KKG61_06970 [bacterium]|nr:hypothetical protein [bacterium]